MPWSSDDFPTSWKNQAPAVRNKAIEIGNALLADGMEESQAIPIALAQARKALDRSEQDPDLWVVPRGSGWAVKEEGADGVLTSHETKDEARDAAVELARERGVAVTITKSTGEIQDRQSFRSRLG